MLEIACVELLRMEPIIEIFQILLELNVTLFVYAVVVELNRFVKMIQSAL